MQKKLLAVAVLSAFSGLAAAQSANVTLYGTIVQNVEQVSATGGDGSTAAGTSSARTGIGGGRVSAAANAAGVADQENRFRFNPAGTNFGIRGTEDLGNGLSAWFQMELAAQMGNSPPTGGTLLGTAASYRNSAVGLRSNTWGTALFGMWDTPFNTMVNALNVNGRSGAASSNHSANMLGGNVFAQGAVSGQATQAWCAATPSVTVPANPSAAATVVAVAGAIVSSAAACANFGMNFDRRERSSIQWWSPNWNGFEARVAYNVTADNGGVTASNQSFGRNTLKQSIWDLSASYTNGGLYVGYAYERQNDTLAAGARTFIGAAGGIGAGEGTGAWTMGTAAAATAGNSHMSGSSGVGHRLGARYRIGNSGFTVGAMWESLKWGMRYSVDAGAAAANAQLLTGLSKSAYRLQGNYVTGKHYIGLDYIRANAMTGSIASATAVAANTFDGSNTGARAWQLGYNYMLSKRTSIGAYYNTIRNETNANYSGIVFGGMATPPGGSPKYLGMHVRHSF